MLKILKYSTLLILFSFSLSFASAEFYEQPYSPRTLKLRRPLNFLNLTSVQIASIILDGEASSGTDIPPYGKYRLSPSSFNEDALKDFLLATNSQEIVILQAKKETEINSNEITLEIYKWDTEKDLNINHFIFTICKVPQQKSKKKTK
ncbi:hypothetical protein IM40_01420 [Candidatus Paracaedimonas acanthamoebae]|nr:hypothetical protein IM40_01420 [Candidatus Paracaedimonas acanthamoebae]